VALEIAYRVSLYLRVPERFAASFNDNNLPAIGVYNRSLWEFDAASGYRYATGDIVLSHVDGGQITSCQKIPTANKFGNMGRVKGDWRTADLKIAVFGDSFSAFVTTDNTTWPTLLQDFLEVRLGRSVNVVNFGRDGTGILQMFDMAKAKIPEWKPDLAIIAFTTNDFARARFWRTVNVIDGELRVLTVPEATPQADPVNSYETFVLHPEATLEWCQSMSYKGHLDRIGKEIVDKYRRFRRPNVLASFSVFTLTHSYLYARIMHGNAFFSTELKAGQRWSPHFIFDNYADDARMMENIRWIKENGIPYLLIHLPIYPEVKANKEFIVDRQEQHLLESLNFITGHDIYRLLDYVQIPVEQPERMNVTPDNYHPSHWGMEFYARAITEILVRNNHIKPKSAASR
jgi:lysophospholipase L1-like esterase